MQSRNWVFTLNNPTDDEYPSKWNLDRVKLIVYQVEIGEQGTLHLQGYVELEGSRKLTYLKGLCGRCHWEPRRGTRSQALLYCTKEESQLCPPTGWTKETERWIDCVNGDLDSFWNGLKVCLQETNTEDGKSSMKSRLLTIQTALKDNSSSIEDVADNEFDLWVRYYRAFEKYSTLKTKPRNHPVEVHIAYGPTGTGKSKWAMETYPNAYWKQRSKWWDGYFKHETVVIDEFYGWLPFDLLLRLLDRYPLLVETKGGQVQFVAKTIVITSNTPPNKWYDECRCYFEALARRITQYHYMPSMGIHSIYYTYQAFKDRVDSGPVVG